MKQISRFINISFQLSNLTTQDWSISWSVGKLHAEISHAWVKFCDAEQHYHKKFMKFRRTETFDFVLRISEKLTSPTFAYDLPKNKTQTKIRSSRLDISPSKII